MFVFLSTTGVSIAAVPYSRVADQASCISDFHSHMRRQNPVAYLCISFCPGKAILEPYNNLYSKSNSL